MASLPQELLDNIFAFLLEEHIPVWCRLRTVTSLSKISILSCRLVQRRWAASKTMIELFTRLIEQNPLVWQKDKLPQLQALVKSDYGRRLKMLTLCRVDQTLDLEGYRKDFYERDVRSRLVELYLTKLLQQLPRVRHVRYYLQTPRTLGSPEARTGFISKLHHFFEITRGETEWTNETAYRNPDWTIDCIQHAFKNAKMPLKSLETPLKGNRIARDAIALGPLQLSATLKRLAVNLSYDILNNRVQTWLSNMPNLEYLELAIADHQRSRFGPDYVFLVDQAHVGSNSRTALPAMKEIRLMGNMDHRFEAEDLFQFLSLFPNLERVGLAHIMFVRNDWTDFLINLADLHLSHFLLLNPRYLTPATRSTMLRLLRNEWALNRYVPTSAINDAAEDVQYIETGSPWTDDGRVPIKGTFDYVGFAIFQEL